MKFAKTLLGILFLAFFKMYGQDNTGVIHLQVQDQGSMQAILDSVQILVSEENRAQILNRGPETGGIHVIKDLKPGVYQVLIQVKGYATFEFKKVVVGANKTVFLRAEMVKAGALPVKRKKASKKKVY